MIILLKDNSEILVSDGKSNDVLTPSLVSGNATTGP